MRVVQTYEIHPIEVDLNPVIEAINQGALIIYPTETQYVLGCAVNNEAGVKRLYQVKGQQIGEIGFPMVCRDIAQLEEYCTLQAPIRDFIEAHTPGPNSFILKLKDSNPLLWNELESAMVRISSNAICQHLLAKLDQPLYCAMIPMPDEMENLVVYPQVLQELLGDVVDYIIDDGKGANQQTTIYACEGNTPEIRRPGS